MRPRTFVPFANAVLPLTTTGSAMLARNSSPALLLSVPTASIIATISTVPAGILTISCGGGAGAGAGVVAFCALSSGGVEVGRETLLAAGVDLGAKFFAAGAAAAGAG